MILFRLACPDNILTNNYNCFVQAFDIMIFIMIQACLPRPDEEFDVDTTCVAVGQLVIIIILSTPTIIIVTIIIKTIWSSTVR